MSACFVMANAVSGGGVLRREQRSHLVVRRALCAALASTMLGGVCYATVALASDPTTAQIRSSLERQLRPPGTTTIASLLKRGGVTYSFKAVTAGIVGVEWVAKPPRPNKRKLQAVIVASGQITFSRPGTKKIRMVLTSGEGTYLLRTSKSVKLTAEGVFTTKSGKSINASNTFVLRR
jgi:hypothetical protein